MQQRRQRLEGKVAIVTGAGSSGPGVGTGKAISTLFAQEGARVLLVDQVARHAEETLATILGEGFEASVFEADVTKAKECQRMVEVAQERYGALNILVNNVGVLRGLDTVVDVEEEDWDQLLKVNLKSMMLTSKYAVPKMIEGGGGSIINISSVGGLRSGPVAYSASKGGVIALTTSMAVHHGRDHIRVNCIAPGAIYTSMVAGHMTEASRELAIKAVPLGTEGPAWDAAWAALFLASDEARWITGVVLPVDAGASATTPLAAMRYLR